jgi:hypothetical protein
MRKIRWMALAPVAGLACVAALAFAQADHGASLNTLTPAEKAAGWKLLFDGHDTKGWRNFMKPGVDAGWVVKDGLLICADPKHTDDIITVDKYADFDMSFEWRISKMGNSGVYYHVIEAGEHGYESGPEYQLLDNAHGEEPKQQAGSLFGLYPPLKGHDQAGGRVQSEPDRGQPRPCGALDEWGEGGRVPAQFPGLQSPGRRHQVRQLAPLRHRRHRLHLSAGSRRRRGVPEYQDQVSGLGAYS